MIRIIVADASVLINLLRVDRIEICGRIPAFEFVVSEHVVAEISNPTQSDRLAAAIEAGVFEVVSIRDVSGLQQFSELTERLGRGEAACLVIAEAAGYSIASDERGLFARLVAGRLGAGRLLTTPDLYLAAIRAGLLTVREADADTVLLEGRRFRMRFASFADILGE